MSLVWPLQQPILRGNSYALRPWRPSDADVVYQACQDPDIQRFTTVPVPYELSDAQAFIAAGEQAWADSKLVQYAIVDAEDQVQGAISFINIDEDERTAQFGYWVAPWGRGQGAAHSALELFSDWGRQVGFNEFTLRIEDDNLASIATAVTAGAYATGESVEVEVKGEQRNLRIFRLI